jgi:hypothetical protein
MGTVYKAHQLSLGRPVAIKILPSDLAAQEQFLERFHREADALSRLSHPNVVTVFDRGEVDGQPYLVMEYVEGTSLRDVMRHGPLPADEALRVVSSVLAALEHAHANGIVHRDIKPENVLLAQGSVVKVADFGLSRLLGPEDLTRLTRTQLVLGTYEYMAPEQRERSKEADPRSDLYATGVVLYEMLTGELPIGRFELPSRRRPEECDNRVDTLIERSLDKDPEQRYQRAIEMADAVSAILERPDVQPAPPSPTVGPQPTYKPVRFEYHIDNVATVNHVLGTIFYVFGFMSLFGVGFLTRAIYISAPFFVFFLAGWYLRATADNLRKYKTTARTAQAVIAILSAFTFLLIPFSIYSLWVLFSHRGRTYYEARGRGLSEQAAARHTYRMLEEPYAPPRPAPPPAAPPPPVAPRPSQIPVQSMVTSEVVDSRKRTPRTSAWVRAGLWTLLGTAVLAGLATAGAPILVVWLAVPALIGAGLLVIGFFHSLVTPNVRGALAAFFALLFLALVAGVVVLYTYTRVVESSRARAATDVPSQKVITVGHYPARPPRWDFEGTLLSDARREWVRQVTGYLGKLNVRRRGKFVSVGSYGDRMTAQRVARAVQEMLVRELQDRFHAMRIGRVPDVEFAHRIAGNPPPD